MLCARWMQVKRLQDQVSRLQNENEELRGELNCFDPAFFDEIEDLKYNHNEMSKVSALSECDHRSSAPARSTARSSALMLHEMLRVLTWFCRSWWIVTRRCCRTCPKSTTLTSRRRALLRDPPGIKRTL